jgi:fibronectin type 3 domain-containing protein
MNPGPRFRPPTDQSSTAAPPRVDRRRTLLAASTVLVAAAALATVALAPPAAAATAPPTPADVELHAGADSSITIAWPASPGATSYRIYRATTAGAEGTTPIATITGTEYRDANLSPTPVYFYQVSAVNAGGESARTPEDASKTPPPIGTGGNTPGVSVGNGQVYYAKDALLGGFDWFQTLTGWFPSVLGSSGSASPGQRVVDMAYAQEGSMTFTNVVVPTSGLYTVDWRYAFQGGLFPGVNNRRMGLRVNGTVITRSQSFPITGSFDTYQHSALQVHLNAGANTISQFAVSDHGLSRVDQLTVTPASASAPTAPGSLTAQAGNTTVALSWGAASGGPTSYSVWRGTKSDGEAITPVGTTTATTFTDTGLHNGTTYFYFVTAVNAVGGSPTTNEVSVVPAASGSTPSPSPTPSSSSSAGTAPRVPFGVVISPKAGQILLQWGFQAEATSFHVWRSTSPGGEGATPLATVTSPTYTDRAVVSGQKYYYQFSALSGTTESARTTEQSATAI